MLHDILCDFSYYERICGWGVTSGRLTIFVYNELGEIPLNATKNNYKAK
jgi:hypothetical protein